MKSRAAAATATVVAVIVSGLASAAQGRAPSGQAALFQAGAAVQSFTPPAFGALSGDPADVRGRGRQRVQRGALLRL